MILEFSVKNFRSIDDLQTLSFRATGLKSPAGLEVVDLNNIYSDSDENVLKTVGIYGANGSGKSNLIRALESFIKVVTAESTSESNLKNLCEPFLYNPDYNNTESFFQFVLLLRGKKYRYGFTTMSIKKVSDEGKETSKEIISKEWLHGTYKTIMEYYFTRRDQLAEMVYPMDTSKIPNRLPYQHTIFLTHASAFDQNSVCTEIRAFLKGLTISNFTEGFSTFRWHSFIAIEQDKQRQQFLDLLAVFNLRYDSISISKQITDNDPFRLERVNFFKRSHYHGEESVAWLNLVENESAGTQRLFEIAGFLLRAFEMPAGGLVILDEIDSNFHPFLVRKIISLFNDPSYNRNNCQLLFTSHDTNLLSPSILRRDQIYFTEKTIDESTRLYSLADLKGIRNDADFAKQYLAGYYGAVPLLDLMLQNNNIE